MVSRQDDSFREARNDGTALLAALAQLPGKYREPLVLHDVQRRSPRETAGLLRWPLAVVRRRLARGRNLLRRRLGSAAPRGERGLARAVLPVAVPELLLSVTLRAVSRLTARARAADA